MARRSGPGQVCALLLVPAALMAAVVAALPAAAKAGPPVYNDPPGYEGLKKAPKTKPPKPAAPVILSATGAGTHPDVLVDEAGTAHITWNEGNGDGADTAEYCRLKRGSRSCDARTTLRWQKGYGAGDGPQFNTDYLGPQIARVGNQLVVLSKRYPTGSEKPDGASSHTVLAWSSNDGGSSWTSEPAIVGTRDVGDTVVFGPADAPTILNIAQDVFCSGQGGPCLQAYGSGEYTSLSGSLATGSNQGYHPSLALSGGLPVAAFADLGGHTLVRRWSGAGSVIDPATWSAPTSIDGDLAGDTPDLAGGPSGLFLIHKPRGSTRFAARRLDPQANGSFDVGRAVAVSKRGDRVLFGRLEEDPGGGVHAGWAVTDAFGKSKPGAWLRSSGGGLGFDPPQRLTRDGRAGQIELAATDDHGGFAALNGSGGCCRAGPILAIGFGSQAPTGELGLGDLPGGSAAGKSCQQVPFGGFEVEAQSGCFFNGAGGAAGQMVTSKTIEIEGVKIVPDPTTKIVIDPKKLRIDTIGKVRVLVESDETGEVVLWHGEIHRDLAGLKPGDKLFEFPVGEYKADILGFPTASDSVVTLGNSAHIKVGLELPEAFGGFEGKAELVADSKTGLRPETVEFKAGPIPIGAVILEKLEITYEAEDELWKGGGELRILPAGGKLAAEVEFAGGKFNGATITIPVPGVPIGPFVYLLGVGGGFKIEPDFELNANATIGAGAAVGGESPVKVNGEFAMSFPEGKPAHFRLGGDVEVLIFETAEGHLEFYTDGYASFGGEIGLDLEVLDIEATMDGFVDADSGEFGASLDGSVSLCAEFDLGITTENICGKVVAADAAISTAGFAACATLNPPDPFGKSSAGLVLPAADIDPVVFANPLLLNVLLVTHLKVEVLGVGWECSTEGYKVPPPKSQAAAAGDSTSFEVPRGLPGVTVLVQGDGGAPAVTLSGPDGTTIDTEQPTAEGFAVRFGDVPATYIPIARPAAGTWTVTEQEGSVPVSAVMTADSFRRATVKARLGGKARKRTIAYEIKHLGHGQRVSFAERGSFGTRLIGSTAKPKGRIRFKPAPVRGSRRTVLAIVKHEGIPTAQQRIGRFKAPRPSRPGPVGKLRVNRRGNTVKVGWRSARGAARYAVTLAGKHGTELGRLVGHKVRGARFTAVRRDERIAVEVRALSNRGVAGKPRKTILRPAR